MNMQNANIVNFPRKKCNCLTLFFPFIRPFLCKILKTIYLIPLTISESINSSVLCFNRVKSPNKNWKTCRLCMQRGLKKTIFAYTSLVLSHILINAEPAELRIIMLRCAKLNLCNAELLESKTKWIGRECKLLGMRLCKLQNQVLRVQCKPSPIIDIAVEPSFCNEKSAFVHQIA